MFDAALSVSPGRVPKSRIPPFAPHNTAWVADVIARHDINIDSLEQEPHMPKDRVSFVITVEAVSEPTIRAAVDAINGFEFMVEPVLLLRVE